MDVILFDAELEEGTPSALVGGKAAGLLALRAAGLTVPQFFVITTEAAGQLPGGLDEAVQRLGAQRIAVRSSASVEDGQAASWAGQFETVLGVPPQEVARAVEQCWQSACSPRVKAYADRVGASVGPIAVVVQEMIPGEASGVLFSRDPYDPERVLISAAWGLGEGVVQGTVPCDTWRVSSDEIVESSVAHKDEAVVLGPTGPVLRAVSPSQADLPCLDEGIVRELARLARRIETDFGFPVDVEFTVTGSRVVVLQARPIAVPIPTGRRVLWDNANIIESYSGITTPLTFSFASRAYTIVYQLFCRVMGVRAAVIEEHQPTFRRMIGLIRGRVYYNLNSWYRVLSLLPGFSFNRTAMETMMGVSDVASDDDAGVGDGRLVEGGRLVALLLRLAWRLLRLERDAARFQASFTSTLNSYRDLAFDELAPDDLLAT
jgi:pyruvate,water dikinase